MQHAISNAGAAEAGYYRQIGLDEQASLTKERLNERAEEIFDTFDSADASDALALAAQQGRDSELNIALAAITQINPSDERPAVRALLLAWRSVANYYAGHRAAQEANRGS